MLSFSYGLADPELFPRDDLLAATAAVLEQQLRDLRWQSIRPKFVYTIPTFQNPTGTTMPLARRQKLVALASEYGVAVAEDDAYGDLRFEGQPMQNLAALDQEGWVVRMGTFSKIPKSPIHPISHRVALSA